jgi:creatinine amidohydrolase
MSNLFENLNRMELDKKNDCLVIIPVGAIEQHGPHLAAGTDFIIIDEVTKAAVSAIAKNHEVIQIPTLPFGFSDHHLQFGATVSLRPETLQLVLLDICRSLLRSGFKNLFILNGHGGNNEIISIVAREFAIANDLRVGASSYWIMAWDELVNESAHDSNRLPGHAGAFETSIMQYLRPNLVKEPLPERKGEFSSNPHSFYGSFMAEDPRNWTRIDGYSDSPNKARSSDGERWFKATVNGVTRALLEFMEGAR